MTIDWTELRGSGLALSYTTTATHRNTYTVQAMEPVENHLDRDPILIGSSVVLMLVFIFRLI